MKQVYNQADVESWLSLAQNDWEFARVSLTGGFSRQVCFLGQQVSEKALKGLIYSLQDDFDVGEIKQLKEHNLEKLAKFAEERGVVVPEKIKSKLEVLNRYYVSTRYPDVLEQVRTYTKEMEQEAVEEAKEILEWVEEKLGIVKAER